MPFDPTKKRRKKPQVVRPEMGEEFKPFPDEELRRRLAEIKANTLKPCWKWMPADRPISVKALSAHVHAFHGRVHRLVNGREPTNLGPKVKARLSMALRLVEQGRLVVRNRKDVVLDEADAVPAKPVVVHKVVLMHSGRPKLKIGALKTPPPIAVFPRFFTDSPLERS